MRELMVGALALVLGVVLGGLLPRAEVRRVQGEMAALQEAQERCNSGVGSDLAGLFIGPALGGTPAPDAPSQPTEVADAPDAPGEAPSDEAPPAPVDPGEELEAAKLALRLRSAQARAALEEDAAPDDDQMAAFDAAVADMNADLHELAADFVERFGDGTEPTRREAMVFAADALDVVITAEDRMLEALTPEQREAVAEEAVDPFSYIDPALVDVLQELDR